MTHSILFGSKEIQFNLSYSERKSLGITVTPDMEVIVKAPIDSTIDKILEKVKKKAAWIIKQQGFFLSFQPKMPERRYVSGETHLYLGRQYRLQITIGDNEVVMHRGSFIEVITKEKSKAGELLKQWYRQKANEKFAYIAKPLVEGFKKHHKQPTGLFIQDMPTRWGSCTTKGKIILNPELIKAPRHCIEYVIIHELCHLVHHDHTQKFIDLQTREMPDWEKWKDKLERLLA
ncbi:SprT family zinc-dependent metalloprotease [Mucilaginibacter sp. 44-25]|uniref:M48 family metallopeptidase n=1 Tax=Mucilaginibacter sp. 44-25 TaxID=1895794 RepID=UPI00095D416D|nr:SprT family zinc-dependent metalloprotease [Mucilaginibacter sp. 44-25]OJW13559.1 MAG: metal-dependent hydrolase [Mucilaginibacter sp. 44-25]